MLSPDYLLTSVLLPEYIYFFNLIAFSSDLPFSEQLLVLNVAPKFMQKQYTTDVYSFYTQLSMYLASMAKSICFVPPSELV